jgi:hypothetical protein
MVEENIRKMLGVEHNDVTLDPKKYSTIITKADKLLAMLLEREGKGNVCSGDWSPYCDLGYFCR